MLSAPMSPICHQHLCLLHVISAYVSYIFTAAPMFPIIAPMSPICDQHLCLLYLYVITAPMSPICHQHLCLLYVTTAPMSPICHYSTYVSFTAAPMPPIDMSLQHLR